MSDAERDDKSRRILFVADELLGYAGNGIGTTTTFVSIALARLGYRVEVLFAGRQRTARVEPEWQRLYDEIGVGVRELAASTKRVEPSYFARAREVELALRADPPDVVVVQDLGALAYTAIELRRLGLAFERTSFVVFCHGTRQWITDVTRKVRVLPGAHAVSVLERASIEHADAVVSPSRYLVDWMQGQGWQLPAYTFVIPHVSRAAATGETPPSRDGTASSEIERVAFFGRLEERKGLRPFLDALNALEPEVLGRFDVEFIGRPTPPWPVERVSGLLSERTQRALRGVTFETELDQHEALARLGRPGTLAIMPSYEENSPNTVYECLENEIPFIASNVAGIRELVASEDHDRVLFEPTAAGIAHALRRVIADGHNMRPAQPAFHDAESLRRWADVFALPTHPLPTSWAEADDPDWVLLLAHDDVPDPSLRETLVHAQQTSGADVVTCGLVVGEAVHLFPGEPRALGLLANGYGTAALVRRSLLEHEAPAARWPFFAGLSIAGAKIVSVPIPLVRSPEGPAAIDTHPAEALSVMNHFERALPANLRFVAELATRLAAAEPQRPASIQPRSLARRAVRRLVRGRRR